MEFTPGMGLELYSKLYVLDQWKGLAQTVLPRVAEVLIRYSQPNRQGLILIDQAVFDLVSQGANVDDCLAVVGDAIEFLIERGLLQHNPFRSRVMGVTSRLLLGEPRPSAPPPAVMPDVALAAKPLSAQASIPAPRTVAPTPATLIETPSLSPSAPGSGHCGRPYTTLREAIHFLFRPAEASDTRTPVKRYRSEYKDLSASTVDVAYRPKWLKLAKWLEDNNRPVCIQEIRFHELNDFMYSLGAITPQTRSVYVAALRALFRAIYSDLGLDPKSTPASLLERAAEKERHQTRRMPPTVEELARVIKHVDGIPDEFTRRSVRLLINMEAFGGPHVKESVAGSFKNINWETGVYHIEKGKGGAPRDILLSPPMLDDLMWLRNYRSARPEDPLFVNLPRGRGKLYAGKRITETTAWRWVSDAGKAVGLSSFPHLLRCAADSLAEAFASRAQGDALGLPAESGEQAPHSLRVLGHRSANISARHNTLPPAEVRRVMESAYREVRSVTHDEPAVKVRALHEFA